MSNDTIVYGARCSWWENISKVSMTKPTPPNNISIPCCPHCGGVLFQARTEAEWFSQADKYEADGHPGYRAMLEWARGKCFPTWEAAKAAFDSRPIN